MPETATLAKIVDTIRPVLEKHGVRKAAIFGSAARGQLKEGSDVDILVELPAGTGLFEFIGIEHELEDEIGRDVDLVTYQSVKPTLRDSILNGPQIQII